MEIALCFVIIALLVERFITEGHRRKEMDDLIRGILSKSSTEYAQSKNINEPAGDFNGDKDSDLVSLTELSDSDFLKAIQHGKEN